MYVKNANGERKPVSFAAAEPRKAPVIYINAQRESYTPNTGGEKAEGSNKMMLYIALAIGVVVVAGSGYMLYKYVSSKNKKEQFGYDMKSH